MCVCVCVCVCCRPVEGRGGSVGGGVGSLPVACVECSHTQSIQSSQ